MINIAFIGVGFIAQLSHLKCFAALPEAKIAALCDKDKNLLAKISQRYGVQNTFTDYHDLLKDKSIDAVVVTLSRYFSAEVYIDVINSGKILLAEKPISLSIHHAEKIRLQQLETGSPVHVGYMRRFDAGVIKFKRLVEDLDLKGISIKRIDAFCHMGNSYFQPFGIYDQYDRSFMEQKSFDLESVEVPPTFRPAYDKFLNTYSHTFDLVEFLTNQLTNVRFSSIDKNGHGTVLMDSSACSEIAVSTATMKSNEWHEGLCFTYEDRYLKLTLPPAFAINQTAEVEMACFGEVNKTVKYSVRPSWAFMNQAREFVNACEKKSFNSFNFESAIRQVHHTNDIFQKNSVQR